MIVLMYVQVRTVQVVMQVATNEMLLKLMVRVDCLSADNSA